MTLEWMAKPKPGTNWIESIPPRFYIAKRRSNGKTDYSLTDFARPHQSKLIGWYSSLDEAKHAAQTIVAKEAVLA